LTGAVVAWSVEELTRWLDDVEPRMEQLDLFAWLDLTPAAAAADVQPAFHAVARTRHPDLFRNRLSAAELDRLVRVYARIAAAYAELRDPARFEEVAASLRPQVARTRTAQPPQVARTPTDRQPPQVGRTATDRQMNARALTCYRRAEGALRVGDLATALLQLRMAVAADPSSRLLRAALQEVTELARKP
jgi:hypothetical protein